MYNLKISAWIQLLNKQIKALQFTNFSDLQTLLKGASGEVQQTCFKAFKMR